MNSFGKLLKIEIFGESHGPEVGVLLDGFPPGLQIDRNELESFIARRKAGKRGTTNRLEADIPQFKSGVKHDITTGAPILVSFTNTNTHSKDYTLFRDIPRPNHSDFVADRKYFTFNDLKGGGHFSGRLTLGLILAGYLAKLVLTDVSAQCHIESIGGKKDYSKILEQAIERGDSLGAKLVCKIDNLPIGLGSPFFDSVESLLAHALFSIPGVKSISFSNTINPSSAKGSDFNDPIIDSTGKTASNNASGIVGGLTNGNPIIFTIGIKPTASISLAQSTFNFATNQLDTLEIQGRHDACFALRVPPIVEALSYFVIADLYLQRLMEIKHFELRNN